MKIAIYARVSSESQAKEGTIDSQIEALRDYAKAHDLNIAFECLDNGYSGTTLIRPGLDQLRNLAQAGSIEGVLILSPDRLSRTQANQIILMEEFKKRNIQVIFTTQTFGDTAEDKLMLQIQGSISEYERVKILDRMRRGMIHSVKNGQVAMSNPPLGYFYIPKSKDAIGHLEINPEEAKIVRYIYELFTQEKLKGFQIAKRLNEESIPCRKNRWWASRIYSVLKSETYTRMAYKFKVQMSERKKPNPKSAHYAKRGNTSKTIRPRGEWFGIPVPAIIEQQTWEKAQELLKQNTCQARRNNNKHDYLLRGLVVCGLCGSMASGYVSNQNTYYSCAAQRNKNILSKPHDEIIRVSRKPFDEKIWLGLTELLSDPENIKAQLDKRMQAKKANLPPSLSTSEFDKELSQLTIQDKRILDAYREEVITLEDLKAEKEKITNRRKVLEGKKKDVLSHVESLGQPQITMNDLGDVSKRFQHVMAKADFPTREKIINLLVNSVTLYKAKAVIQGNIPVSKFDVLSPSVQGRRLRLVPPARKLSAAFRSVL